MINEMIGAPRDTPNLEALKIWVDGLLSDEFEQGQGQLAQCSVDSSGVRGPEKHCCLGVISELSIRHGLDVHRNEVSRYGGVLFEYDGQRDFLPPKVREWLGIENENPSLLVTLSDGTKEPRNASALNDGEAEDSLSSQPDLWGNARRTYLPRYTFRDIALAIVRTYNLPGYEHLLEEADDKTD